MKTLFAVWVLVLAPVTALAGTLVTGTVSDQDGYAVESARVEALDAAGNPIGRAETSADGTFAIDAAGRPDAVAVRCTYCERQRAALGADLTAVVIMNRHAALRDRSPSSDDIAALPYGNAAAIAGLIPYTITQDGSISDRGLDGGRAAIAVDGLPSYRSVDGADLLRLVPAYAVTSIAAASPVFAPVYGNRGDGGLFNIGTLGAPSGGTLTGGGGGSAIAGRWHTPAANVALATSQDETGAPIRRIAADVRAPFAGGTLTFVAADAGDATDNASGTSARYVTSSRRYVTSALVSVARSAGDAGSVHLEDGDVEANAGVRSTGPAGTEIGVRMRRSTGGYRPFSFTGRQAEDALYADTRVGDANLSLTGAVAFQRDAVSVRGATTQSFAVLPSVELNARISDHWSVRSSATTGIRDAYLVQVVPGTGVPQTLPLIRATFADVALAYTDLSRVRIDTMAYTQQSQDGSRVHGIGLNAAWEAAPHLALRAWILDAGADGPYALGSTPAAYPPPALSTPGYGLPLRSHAAWITYTNGIRIDVIAKTAGLDGSVAIPIGRASTLVVGGATGDRGRIATISLRTR